MRSHKPAWAAGFAALTLLIATWVAGTARYGGPDEPAHVIRAAAVAQGDLLGTATEDFAPGFRIVTVPAELATGDPICFRQDRTIPAGCSASRDIDGSVRAGTAAGIYPPLYYALVGLPVRLVGLDSSSDAHRIVAALLVVLVLVVAAARARGLGRASLLVAAGVSPAAWFLFGVVNPNGIEIALALLAWVGVSRLAPDACRSSLGWVAVPAAAAIMVRPVAMLAAAAICGVAAVLVDGWRRRAVLVAPLTGAALAIAGWNSWVGLDFTDPRTAEAATFAHAVEKAVKGIPSTMRESVGSLSWQEMSAPWPAMVLWGLGAVVLVAIAWTCGAPRMRIASGVWLAVLVAGPVIFEVVAHDRVGFIWQGRYSIATLVGVGALAARAARSRPGTVGWSRIAPALLGAAAVAEVAAFWAVLRRFTVGTDGPLLLGTPHGWDPLVDPRLLLGVHLAVVAGSCVLVMRAVRADPRLQPTK